MFNTLERFIKKFIKNDTLFIAKSDLISLLANNISTIKKVSWLFNKNNYVFIYN